MRNLSEVSIHNRVLVWYFIILVAIAGIFSYMKLGRMEDPAYTVRTMVVSVAWPGATAEQMQEQVTDNPLLDIRYHDVRPAGDKAIRPSTISAAAVIPWKPGSWPSSASSPCPGRS